MVRIIERSQRLGCEAYLALQSAVNTTLGKVSNVWNCTKGIFNAKFPKTGAKIYSINSAFHHVVSSLINKVSSLYSRIFSRHNHLVVNGNQPQVDGNPAISLISSTSELKTDSSTEEKTVTLTASLDEVKGVEGNPVPLAADPSDAEERAMLLSLLPRGEENLTKSELQKAVNDYKRCISHIRAKNHSEAQTKILNEKAAQTAMLNVIRERRNLV